MERTLGILEIENSCLLGTGDDNWTETTFEEMVPYDQDHNNHKRCVINGIVTFSKRPEMFSYVIIQQVPIIEKKPKFGARFNFTRLLKKHEKTRWEVYMHPGPQGGYKDDPYCYYFAYSADSLKEVRKKISKEIGFEIAIGKN